MEGRELIRPVSLILIGEVRARLSSHHKMFSDDGARTALGTMGRVHAVAEQRDSDSIFLMGEPYDSLYEMPLEPYIAEDGMTLSELVRRVGNLANVVLTYRREDVQPFIEEAVEADHPIWSDASTP